LALAASLGVASAATAATITINTDASWLATNVAPYHTWSFDPGFDTTGWTNAFVWNPGTCFFGASCIWYDGQFSTTQYVWLRRTFTISDPILTAFLDGGVDDDADIYINGFQVVNDHDLFAGGTFAPQPIDIAPYLIQGVNLIAVAAEDNVALFGNNHTFVAQLRIETATATPEPASLLLLGAGCAGFAVLRRRKQQS
jgi:hypothetical protein